MADKRLILLLLPFLRGSWTEKVICDGVIFNHVYYDKETLFDSLGRPYNLIMHKFSGLLFFSHTVHNGTHVDFVITCCQIEMKVCHNITSVPGGYAIAYDAGNDDIYFGGHDGIYKYNFLTKSADFFAEEGKSVWGIFVKRNFYYIQYPAQKLLVYQDDDFVPVMESSNFEIDHFFISKHMDVYYSNRTALFKVEKPNKDAIMLSDDTVIRQIAEDGYGDIYFCASNGIHIEDKPFHKIKQVAIIVQAFGLAFDEHDNIIYSDQGAIHRLKPSKVADLCYEVLNTPTEKEAKILLRDSIIS